MPEPTNSSSVDPSDYKIHMDTQYLVDTYGQYFQEIGANGITYYVEKPCDNDPNRERYVATLAKGLEPSRSIHNLAVISGPNAWKDNFSEEELEQISKTVTLIKVNVHKDDYVSEEANSFHRDIILPDGSPLKVEYYPYIEDLTDAILNHMNEHIPDVAE